MATFSLQSNAITNSRMAKNKFQGINKKWGRGWGGGGDDTCATNIHVILALVQHVCCNMHVMYNMYVVTCMLHACFLHRTCREQNGLHTSARKEKTSSLSVCVL